MEKPVNSTPSLPGNNTSEPLDKPQGLGASFETRNVRIPSTSGGNANTGKGAKGE